MGKKKGRPVKEGSRRNKCDIRLSDAEIEMLDFVSMRTGKTNSDVLREGLKTLYNLERCKLFTD